MQNTSGNTILTPVFAAASSARCRRLVRTVSECTRSDCATLVPNLSVCTSIATSDTMSSTPVRSARLRSAPPPPLAGPQLEVDQPQLLGQFRVREIELGADPLNRLVEA